MYPPEDVAEYRVVKPRGALSLTTQFNGRFADFRVLVVEDEYLIAEEISDTLRDIAIDVVGPIGNLQEASEAVQDASLNWAVLDINISGGASFPLIDILIHNNVPVLLMTGYDQEELPFKYRGLPMIQKPLLRGDLAEAFRKLFEI